MLKEIDLAFIRKYFLERFGIPEDAFSGYRFFATGRSVWMTTAEDVERLLQMKRIEYPGIRLMRRIDRYTYKPTTYALQLVGDKATRNLITLCREELSELIERGRLTKDFPETEEGYVIIRYGEDILGCGLYRGNILKSQFPRGRTEALASSGLY